jgi:peptidyl-prolyl cis-trans isomerase B (cyclophilin B)
MNLPAGLALLFSIIAPSRMWYAPNMPLVVQNTSDVPINLVLTDFTPKILEVRKPGDKDKSHVDRTLANLGPHQEVDLKSIFPDASHPGSYLLFAVPQGKAMPDFVGTPLVVEVRADTRPNNPKPDEVMVTKIEPLRYLSFETEMGPMTAILYYDVAPHTAAAIISLAQQGFYDGLGFHRVVPGFVIQAGDPLGDGRGGPGFHIDAEFNDHRHEEGVLSMARAADPLEPEMTPRCEFANSAGSQFFICLANVDRLDGRYTAFGKVVRGIETVRKIAQVPIADPKHNRPAKPPLITKITVKNVTPQDNPYIDYLNLAKLRVPEIRPSTPSTGNPRKDL